MYICLVSIRDLLTYRTDFPYFSRATLSLSKLASHWIIFLQNIVNSGTKVGLELFVPFVECHVGHAYYFAWLLSLPLIISSYLTYSLSLKLILFLIVKFQLRRFLGLLNAKCIVFKFCAFDPKQDVYFCHRNYSLCVLAYGFTVCKYDYTHFFLLDRGLL